MLDLYSTVAPRAVPLDRPATGAAHAADAVGVDLQLHAEVAREAEGPVARMEDRRQEAPRLAGRHHLALVRFTRKLTAY